MVYGGLRPLGQEVSVSGPGSPESPSIFRQFLSVDRPGPDGLRLGLRLGWRLGSGRVSLSSGREPVASGYRGEHKFL